MGKESAPRNFGVFLGQVDEGGLIHELSELTQEVIDALAKHAQSHSTAKGQIALVLNFKADAKGVVEVTTDIKSKTPKASRGKSIFWTNDKGQLVNENPKQPGLPFRDVNATDKAVKDAIGEGGVGHARAV